VRGYAEIGAGLAVEDFFHPRRREEMLWEIIGQRSGPDPLPSIGLYSWIEHARCMLARIEMTLSLQWAFPGIIDGPMGARRLPARPEPLPRPTGTRIGDREGVPVSGVWIPLDIPNGCPNYLWAGRLASPGRRPAQRIDRPAYQQTDEVVPAITVYEYEPTPTRWELVWEDRRYEGGVLPDETEYLQGDDLAAFPACPPRHQPR
jgi:hypothetical protein